MVSRILLNEYEPHLAPEARRYPWCGTTPSKWVVWSMIIHLLAPGSLSAQNSPFTSCVRLTELRHEQENRHVEISSSELPVCEADPALLKQVWINLLTPSIYWRPPKSRSAVNKHVKPVYFVKDNGL